MSLNIKYKGIAKKIADKIVERIFEEVTDEMNYRDRPESDEKDNEMFELILKNISSGLKPRR